MFTVSPAVCPQSGRTRLLFNKLCHYHPITHEFVQLLSQVGKKKQCVAITTYFTLQMITVAAMLNERREMKSLSNTKWSVS